MIRVTVKGVVVYQAKENTQQAFTVASALNKWGRREERRKTPPISDNAANVLMCVTILLCGVVW